MREKHVKKHALTPEMEKRKWRPGQSGNLGGRPTKKNCLTSILAEYLGQPCFLKDNQGNPIFSIPDPKTGKPRELTWREAVVIATLINAVKGNAAAQREVWERTDGKVPLAVPPEPEKSEPFQVIISEKFVPEILRRELRKNGNLTVEP
jgi:hypothetical protein